MEQAAMCFKTMQFVIIRVCILLLTFPAILIYIDYKSIYAPMQIQDS